jgi:vacuolar iron transporter family protein
MRPRIETAHPAQHAPSWWWSVREIILGANDGLVSTLAFVAGAAAAVADPDLILLATIVEVVAGSISMGFGAYVASRSRTELERRELAVERRHLKERPEEERAELQTYLAKHGLQADDVDEMVRILEDNEELYLSFMGGLELGVQMEPESPSRAGWSMAAAFALGSLPPALPFLFIDTPMVALAVSIGASLVFLVGIGLWRSYIGATKKGRSVLEMILVGAIATAAGYFLGHLAASILGV